MACGTPILTTPVGIISNIIKDGKNGFILENNSPDCIAKNIIKILKYPSLDDIVKNARTFVEEKYTYENAVESYWLILQNLSRN